MRFSLVPTLISCLQFWSAYLLKSGLFLINVVCSVDHQPYNTGQLQGRD